MLLSKEHRLRRESRQGVSELSTAGDVGSEGWIQQDLLRWQQTPQYQTQRHSATSGTPTVTLRRLQRAGGAHRNM